MADLGLGPDFRAPSATDEYLLSFFSSSDSSALFHRGGTSRSMNRPGMSGDSSSWKGWGHVRWFIEEV
ncbi:hypothetical protein, partial [Mycobacterium canetti]|uniref:hypothetical protein n=1 Tax=Mycobacterium canetti TaxID=78331 RepID=UPI001EE3B9B9